MEFKTVDSFEFLPPLIRKAYHEAAPSLCPDVFFFENNGAHFSYDYVVVKDLFWSTARVHRPIPELENYVDSFVDRGYNAPITNIENNNSIELIYSHYCKYMQEKNCICELFKLPKLSLHRIGIPESYWVQVKNTCGIDLKDRDFFSVCDGKNRNILRKSLKEGNKPLLSTEYKTFVDLYNDSMKEKGAGANFFVSEKGSALLESSDILHISVVNDKSGLLAAGVFYINSLQMDYGLSFVTQAGRKSGAGVQLIYEAYEVAKQKGIKFFYLGGGISSEENDALFRFKRSLSNVMMTYYIVPVVYNRRIYEGLVADSRIDSNILLKYRLS
jgi:UDP-N-acetylbacillosamine alanyltransferase